MPYKAEELSVNWVASNSDLEKAVMSFDSVVGIDSEFKRTNTFYPIPALYQVASNSKVFLIDPRSVEDWSPFVEFLEDDSKLKVFHACQEDLELFSFHMSVAPSNLFDTQLANAFLSESYSLSYANLVEEILGVALQKNETRSDWLRRPLTEAQLEYAVEDVHYLAEMYLSLKSKLEGNQRLNWFLEDNADRTVYKEIEPSEYYRIIKRAWQLDGPSLATLKDLGEWRELKAREKNVPRRRVVWDEHLIEFAKKERLTEDEVRQTLPPLIFEQFGEEIIETHRSKDGKSPPPAVARPLSASQNGLVKKLKEIAQKKAKDLGFSVELLGRKKDLEECVRNFEETRELSVHYLGWRESLVGSEFLRLLDH